MLKFSKKLLLLIVVATLFLGVSALAAYAEDIIYYVKTGDTLYKLSTRFNVPINTIKQANNLRSEMLVINQRLYVPGAPGFWNYTVRPGDTFYLIGQRFGVSVGDLQVANNYWSSLYPGQIIVIPPAARVPAPQPAPTPPAGGQIYTVKYGDTLYLIAQRFGATIGDLRVANNLWTDNLMIGQQLVIPAAPQKPKPPTGSISLRDDEVDLLARLVSAESAGEPYEGQVAVAASILNRMRSPNYPHTVREVIYQVVDGKYYQFSPVLDGRINEPATATAFKAVQDALAGWDPSGGAIGFYNPQKTYNRWVASQPVTAVIGNHVFFRE